MINASEYHDPQFDSRRREVHNFVAQRLNVLPIGNVALFTSVQPIAKQLREHEGGRHFWEDDTALVLQKDHPAGPFTSRAIAETHTAHEIAHSARIPRVHYFFDEALPGFVEQEYLQHLKERRLFVPPRDFRFTKEGANFAIPGYARLLDAREDDGSDRWVLTSSGLVAAVGVGAGLRRLGLTGADVLMMNRLRGSDSVRMMQDGLDAIKPGLAHEVGLTPETSAGMNQAATIIHEAALKHAPR